MQNSKLIYIKSREDAKYLLHNHKIYLVPRYHPQIVLELENLSSDENKKWSDKINTSYYSCGCSEGRWFLLFGLAVCFYCFLKINFINIHLTHIVFSIFFLFFIALFGKILGIFWSRFLFKNVIKRLLMR